MRLGRSLCLAVLFLALTPCGEPAEKLRLRPPLWVDPDDREIPEPRERGGVRAVRHCYNTWLRHLSPEYKAEATRDRGALNVNAWDEVPDSSWFTNRIGRHPLSFEEIAAGLDGRSPEPGPWKILRINDEGYTPKFDIEDSAGRRYVLKFDLPDALERNSAAERICTLIMHAAGYHVPHNSIVYFRRGDLRLEEKSYYRLSRPAASDDATGSGQRISKAEAAAGRAVPRPGQPVPARQARRTVCLCRAAHGRPQ